jgi:hypothetical protein
VSRSRKKNPHCGHAGAESEKADKKIWHSRMRARERLRLHHDPEGVTTCEDDVSNVWGMAKDGKQYWPDEKNYRK